MDADIRGTIERIESSIDKLERRTAKLQLIKNLLIEEFDDDEDEELNDRDPKKPRMSDILRQPGLPEISAAVTIGKTRKQVLSEYLHANGPTGRADLIKGTGVPEGTVSYELNDKRTFRRTHDGKWDIAPDIKETLDSLSANSDISTILP